MVVQSSSTRATASLKLVLDTSIAFDKVVLVWLLNIWIDARDCQAVPSVRSSAARMLLISIWIESK